MRSTIDFGIDLGTSNSAIALQDGITPRLLEQPGGCVLLPSVVHIRADGVLLLGAEAVALRAADPDNTASEFKRQMGTSDARAFPASGRTLTAVEMSAEVLRCLARRAVALEGGPLRAAVITIPAMFQLPQCEATRQAAALAGIEHAPLLQEPIAAALAHHGSGHAGDGHWLVFDLGGGTFDVSLVRARAGRLQVLDHDGDNHLGGKDLNRAVARWVIDKVRKQGQLGEFRRTDTAFAMAFARIGTEAERVRVLLSDHEQAAFRLPGIAPGQDGRPVDIDFTIDRGLLESLLAPTLQRTIVLCRALLERNRLRPAELKGTVLVGGPTRTPCVRALLASELGLEARHTLDPTTIVAAGAALFAATQKRPPSLRPASTQSAASLRLDLEYEPMTTNPAPTLVGRVLAGPPGLSVRVVGVASGFDSGQVPINGPAFAIKLRLRPNELNPFRLEASRQGIAVPCEPTSFAILHGMSIAKPPLSQSVGVMLSDNSACWYLQKGAVLPARNTVTHATTVALARGQTGDAIKVPLVQGECERADRNQIIGILCLHADHIARDLPAGSAIEITLSVDEFSRTTARGYVPLLDQWFDHVARLESSAKDATQVSAGLEEQMDRLRQLELEAESLEAEGGGGVDKRAEEVEQLIGEGDRDSLDIANQLLLVMARHIDQVEGASKTTALMGRFSELSTSAREVVGDDAQVGRELQALTTEFDDAVKRGDMAAAEARIEAVESLKSRIIVQQPWFWRWYFVRLSEHIKEAGLEVAARPLLQEGQKALYQGDAGMSTLIQVCTRLAAVLPEDKQQDVTAIVSNVTGGGPR
jgi:molecular chaperone DnaK